MADFKAQLIMFNPDLPIDFSFETRALESDEEDDDEEEVEYLDVDQVPAEQIIAGQGVVEPPTIESLFDPHPADLAATQLGAPPTA